MKNSTLQRIIFATIFLLLSSLGVTAQKWPRVHQRADSLMKAIDLTIASTDAMVDTLGRIAAATSIPALGWRHQFRVAEQLYRRGDVTRAQALVDSLLKVVPAAGEFDYDRHRIASLSNSWRFENNGNYYNMWASSFHDAEYYRSQADYVMEAISMLNIGRVFNILNAPFESLNAHNKAEECLKKSRASELLTLVDFYRANCYVEMGRRDTALTILRRIEHLPADGVDPMLRIKVLGNICSISEGVTDSTRTFYTQRLAQLLDTCPNEQLKMSNLICVAQYHKDMGNYAEAITIYDKLLAYFQTHSMSPAAQFCYDGLSICHSHMSHWQESYNLLRKYVNNSRLWAENSHRDRVKKMAELSRINSFTVQIEKERRAARLRTIAIAVGSGIMLVILVWLTVILWRRHKKAQASIAKEQETNEALNRRIAADALVMCNQATTLSAIGRDLADTPVQAPPEHHSFITNLKTNLRLHMSADAHLRTFADTFEQVAPQWMAMMKQRYPVLTEYDLRFCSLLYIGLDSRQISTLLNIQPASVKKSRTRLRKKLQLDPSVELEMWLRQFTPGHS